MQNPKKAAWNAGGNDCPLGQNGCASFAPKASTNALRPKGRSSVWPEFTVSWPALRESNPEARSAKRQSKIFWQIGLLPGHRGHHNPDCATKPRIATPLFPTTLRH